MLKLLCALKVGVTAFICLILGLIMPAHIQRALFITTLYVQLTKENILESTTLEKLNTKLGLASVESSLEFNAAWTDVVWNNVNIRNYLVETLGPSVLDPKHKLTYNEITVACGFIVDKCPKCLTYGNRNQMVADIRALFTCPMSPA